MPQTAQAPKTHLRNPKVTEIIVGESTSQPTKMCQSTATVFDFHTISCLLVHCKLSCGILQRHLSKSFFVNYPCVIKCGPAELG